MLKTDIPQIYEKTTWVDLETLAEARLMNKIESGIEMNSIHAVTLNSQVTHVMKKLEEIEGDRCQCDPLLGTNVATNTSDINALKLRVNQIPPLDFDINQKVNTNVSNIATLSDRLHELENDSSTDAGLLAAIEKNKIGVANNKADITSLGNDVQAVKTKADDNSRGVSANTALIAGLNSSITGLTSTVGDAAEKAEQALVKSVENTTAIGTLESDVATALSKATSAETLATSASAKAVSAEATANTAGEKSTAANNKAIEAYNLASLSKGDIDKLIETVDFHKIDVRNLYDKDRLHDSQVNALDEHVMNLTSKDRQLEMSIENHTHTQYAEKSHTHTEYARSSHSHNYASTNHEHSEIDYCLDVYNGLLKTKASTVSIGSVSGGTSVVCGSSQDFYRVDASLCGGYANESLGQYSSYQVASVFCGQQNKSINSSRNILLGGGNEARSAHASIVGGTLGRLSGENKILAGFGGMSLEATRANGLDDILILGNGQLRDTALISNNAFKVSSDGAVFAESALNTTGADYAEYFEWLDGNPNSEDRVGIIVTLEGDKIRPATADDAYILGIISATPAIIGDSFNERWKGKYETDVWGRIVYETVTTTNYCPAGIERLSQPESKIPLFDTITQIVPKLNPTFKTKTAYVPREHRVEFAPVGLVGKLLVKDDGTATVNGYVKSDANGVATASTEMTGMRVMERISENIVRVMFK